MSKYDPDWIDGHPVPPWIVMEDRVLVGDHSGTVHVESGHFEVRGTLRGTLVIHRGARVSIQGTQAGSVHVGPAATLTVSGALNGQTLVERTGSVLVEAAGRLAGGLVNEGSVVIRGVYGGKRSGAGSFALEGAGRIKQPEFIDGVAMYVWRDHE